MARIGRKQVGHGSEPVGKQYEPPVNNEKNGSETDRGWVGKGRGLVLIFISHDL